MACWRCLDARARTFSAAATGARHAGRLVLWVALAMLACRLGALWPSLAWAAIRASPRPQQKAAPPAPVVTGLQAAHARDRRVGRVHRPLRCRRDRRDARARLRLPQRGALQGRPARQAGRPAVRDRPAALRARAGAGPGRAVCRPRPRSRTPTSTSCAASRWSSGKIISDKTFDDRDDLRARGAGGGEGGGGQGQDGRARPVLHPHHLADRRPHQPHAWSRAGNWVSAGGVASATLLTTIVSQDPIYIYFDVSENNYIKYKRLAERGEGAGAADLGAPVEVALPDERGFPHKAQLDFLDNRLDQGTGTLRARAVLRQQGRAVLARPVRARARDRHRRHTRRCCCPTRRSAPTRPTSTSTPSARTASVARRNVTARAAGRRPARGARGPRRRRLGDHQGPAARPARPEGDAQARGAHRLGGVSQRRSAKEQRMTSACRRRPAPRARGPQRMRISHFFIDRPIFAAVVALVITIIGAIGYSGPRHHAAARDHPADHHRHRQLSRRQRADRRRHGCGADRAGDQRRRGHDLHGLAVDLRRQPVADRDVRRRHRHRQGAGAGAEPRQRRRAAAARRGAPQRPDRAQALARPAAGDPPDLARQAPTTRSTSPTTACSTCATS